MRRIEQRPRSRDQWLTKGWGMWVTADASNVDVYDRALFYYRLLSSDVAKVLLSHFACLSLLVYPLALRVAAL